jgi:two-component system, chemotaxis family, CheB/CheR fusion protein
VKHAAEPNEHKIAALLDMHGRIVSVNDAWRRFGRANNATPETIEGVGLDYIAACLKSEEPLSQVVAQGVRRVLNGSSPSFSQIYGCHSPEETRWFRVEVTARHGEPDAVVVHALYH